MKKILSNPRTPPPLRMGNENPQTAILGRDGDFFRSMQTGQLDVGSYAIATVNGGLHSNQDFVVKSDYYQRISVGDGMTSRSVAKTYNAIPTIQLELEQSPQDTVLGKLLDIFKELGETHGIAVITSIEFHDPTSTKPRPSIQPTQYPTLPKRVIKKIQNVLKTNILKKINPWGDKREEHMCFKSDIEDTLDEALVQLNTPEKILRFISHLTNNHNLNHSLSRSIPPGYTSDTKRPRVIRKSTIPNEIIPIEPEDTIMVCSDGISDVIGPSTMQEIYEACDNNPQETIRIVGDILEKYCRVDGDYESKHLESQSPGFTDGEPDYSAPPYEFTYTLPNGNPLKLHSPPKADDRTLAIVKAEKAKDMHVTWLGDCICWVFDKEGNLRWTNPQSEDNYADKWTTLIREFAEKVIWNR